LDKWNPKDCWLQTKERCCVNINNYCFLEVSYSKHDRPSPATSCNLQTRPLVREGTTKLQTRNCLQEISRRTKNWSQVPDGRLTPGQTGRLTVGRKLTATATANHKVTSTLIWQIAFGICNSSTILSVILVNTELY
jgi:hypothetical protein